MPDLQQFLQKAQQAIVTNNGSSLAAALKSLEEMPSVLPRDVAELIYPVLTL
jgi:hypothetical protein